MSTAPRRAGEGRLAPCNVLYVAQTAKGGSAVSLYHLVKGLDRNRYNPTVLFFTQEDDHIPNRLARLGVRVVTLRRGRAAALPSGRPDEEQRRDIRRWLASRFGDGAGRTYHSLKTLYQFTRSQSGPTLAVWRAIREQHADLVHVNSGLLHGRPAIAAARLAGVPCVCHVHMFSELSGADLFFARGVAAFLYISTAIAADYVHQGVPADKGTVVHNAVDLSEFAVAPDVSEVRREFDWSATEYVAGVVGRLDWWKGHEYFLEAIAAASQQLPNLRGLIVGAPETSPRNQAYFERIHSMTRSLGLEGKVVFTGFRSDVPRLMAGLDVVVLSSSRPEPFGLVVIEGMAAGKAVVATAAGGVVDIIEDNVSGLLVPSQDSAAIAAAILRLAADPSEAARIGQAARRRVAERFTPARYVAAVEALYASSLAARRSAERPAAHRRSAV